MSNRVRRKGPSFLSYQRCPCSLVGVQAEQVQLKDGRMRGANNQYSPATDFLRQMPSFSSSLNADQERILASARLMLLKGPGRACWWNTKIELEPRYWGGHDNASIQHELCEVVEGPGVQASFFG